MILKLLGVQHSTGIFQEKPYDNYNLFLLDESKRYDNVYGFVPNMFLRNGRKVPYLVVKAAMFNTVVSPDQIKSLIGQNLDIDFDMYGNPSRIQISK